METNRVGDKRGGSREDGEREDLGLGFGFGSSPHPHKLIRTGLSDHTGRSGYSSLHPIFAAAAAASAPFPGGSSAAFYDGARVLQPFPAASSFRSSGCVGMGGASSGASCSLPFRVFPFTPSQWQELQRQALIYKHIVSSVPVPPDLLFPIATPFSDAPPDLFVGAGRTGGCFNLRFTNGLDPEPGRCRRTDGKKWRCSRDAAPDQKYCERHIHRGRPRSRKPVEHKSRAAVAAAATAPATAAVAINSSSTIATPSKALASSSISSGFPPKPALKFPFQSMEAPIKEQSPRYLDWMKGGSEEEMGARQPWEIGLGSNPAPASQQLEDHLNLTYTGLNSQCCPLILNTDLSSLEETTIAPRRFIDAWSTENVATATNHDDSTCAPTGRDLTLSMSGDGVDDEETGPIETGLGLGSQPLPASWMGPAASPLGGPLAEVLQSSNRASPRDNGCSRSSGKASSGLDLMSPPESPRRLHHASSPSGVLHKALVSLSDSSSSSSPPFGGASRSDVAFQWLNQAKVGSYP